MERMTEKHLKGLFPGLAAAFFLLAPAAARANAFDFESEAGSISEMVVSLKEAASSRKTPVISTSAPLSSELAHFWADLKKDTFDDICRSAEIKLNKDGRLANVFGLEGGFKRYLRKFPSEKVALIDEAGVKLSAALGNDTLQLPELGSLNISLTGVLEGRSQVVRPLENDRYCRELGTLVKFREVKTVLPATAQRIMAMKSGEIWKLPLALRLGFGMGTGTVLNEALSVSISAGKSREHNPSVTLYRIDDNNLRLRIRLERVEVRSAGVSASSVEIPLADIGLINGENILAREINKAWAREINKYIALKLSYGRANSSGKKLLLEFILDPHNAEQLAGLEKFLSGDFGIVKRFIEMELRFNGFSEDEEGSSGLGDLEGAAGQAGQALNSGPSFAGSNIYHGQSTGLHTQVPIMHSHENSWSSSYNRYQSLANEGETMHVHQRTRVSNGSSLNITFVGTVVKYDSQKNIYVINKEKTDGRTTRPMLMYQQNEGFVKNSDGSARYMLERANGVLRYVGRNGNGTDALNLLPAAQIFPPQALEPGTDPLDAGSKVYESSMMSFKLLINGRGVQEILLAPAMAVMNAYMNMMREVHADIIDKVMDLFTINKEGKVAYDHKAAVKRLASHAPRESGTNPLEIVHTLAYAATQVLRDISSIREASGWKDQSDRLAKVASGSSKSNLKYEDFLKVAVQLVNPENISAEVYVHTDKRVKGEADVSQSYRFFNGRENDFDGSMAEINQVRDRFAEPSELTD